MKDVKEHSRIGSLLRMPMTAALAGLAMIAFAGSAMAGAGPAIVVVDDEVSTTPNTPVTFNVTNNDTINCPATLTFDYNGAGGVVSYTGSEVCGDVTFGQFAFTPNRKFEGVDTGLSYVIDDGNNNASHAENTYPGLVTINVAPADLNAMNCHPVVQLRGEVKFRPVKNQYLADMVREKLVDIRKPDSLCGMSSQEGPQTTQSDTQQGEFSHGDNYLACYSIRDSRKQQQVRKTNRGSFIQDGTLTLVDEVAGVVTHKINSKGRELCVPVAVMGAGETMFNPVSYQCYRTRQSVRHHSEDFNLLMSDLDSRGMVRKSLSTLRRVCLPIFNDANNDQTNSNDSYASALSCYQSRDTKGQSNYQDQFLQYTTEVQGAPFWNLDTDLGTRKVRNSKLSCVNSYPEFVP